jgi:hypothetical protein
MKREEKERREKEECGHSPLLRVARIAILSV